MKDNPFKMFNHLARLTNNKTQADNIKNVTDHADIANMRIK
jgi:hypothetical protein